MVKRCNIHSMNQPDDYDDDDNYDDDDDYDDDIL